MVRAPPCHGGGREFESLLGRFWGLSSAGRASALQAEGHRFEPYRPHFTWEHVRCRRGGTGRRPGLKIPWVAIPVPVRSRSPAVEKSELLQSILQQFFHCIGNAVPYAINPSGGCALRAKEIWPLKRPRFGAGVRPAGLFVSEKLK